MKKQLLKGIFLLSILLCFSCQQSNNNDNKTNVDNSNDTEINDTTPSDTVPDDEGTDDEGTDNEGTEGEEPEDEETEIVKTKAECERDIAAVKNLIEIPTTAIATSGFVYCDLPIAVQGYKDVSISWESNSSYFAIDNDVGILSNIPSTQLIKLTATISCGDYSDKKNFTIKAYPKNSALTQTECIEAAIFALSFGEKIRNLNNAYVISTSVLQYMDFEQMSNIRVTVSSEDSSVELTAPTSMSAAYKINIKKAPVQKIVKITVNFNYSGIKKTRVYYIDVKSDKTEFAGACDHKEYGNYKFEDNKLHFTASKSSYNDAIYNYVISDT